MSIRRPWNKARAIYGLASVLFLAAGVCIYLLFRDLNDLLISAWVPMPEFAKGAIVQLSPSVFSNMLKYNLAGMFWFVSGILFFRFVWFHKINVQRIYVWCFYGMGAILEAVQLLENVPGTFDPLDMLFMGTGALIEGLLYNVIKKRRRNA